MSEISKLQQKILIKKIDKETLNIQILDNNILLLIVGEFNENLKKLETNGKTKGILVHWSIFQLFLGFSSYLQICRHGQPASRPYSGDILVYFLMILLHI